MGSLRTHLSPAQKQEVIEMYRDTTTEVRDIARAYNVAKSTVSRIAQANGLSRRPRPAAPAAPDPSPTFLEVTTDHEGLVQSVHRTPATPPPSNEPQWEVKFEGLVRVRATSIEEALERARRHTSGRITSVVRL